MTRHGNSMPTCRLKSGPLTKSGPPIGGRHGGTFLSRVVSIWTSLFIVSAVSAAPQGLGTSLGGQPAANEVTEFRGTLKSVRGKLMTVTREDGTDVLVQMPDSPPDLKFVAKALLAYLRRGMWVRFDTNLGPAGMPVSPVNKLVVFAPIPTNALPMNQRMLFTPGVHARDPANRGKQVFTGRAVVVGNLVMLTPQGGLAMQVGRKSIQTMVSPSATIEIQLNNLSLAQAGDPVSVAGFFQPPDDTKVKGDRVTISPERVYGEVAKKPARRARGSQLNSAGTGEDADESSDESE
ncbi:MAG: hypothetical protein AAGJ40_15470 [Planctomycetota bacterium]